MPNLLHFVLLALYAGYVFFMVDRTKPIPWLLGHAVVVLGGAFGVLFHTGLYFLVGGSLGVALTLKSLLVDKLPFSSNMLAYGKAFLQNLFFCPVQSFETLYQWFVSATKLKLPTLPKV